MICRVCGIAGELVRLWPADDAIGDWWRCLACGSDSNATKLPTKYDADYLAHLGPTVAEQTAIMRPNLDWFDAHAKGCPDRTFLDVGCLQGAALTGMQSRGWAVHGFDVIPEAKTGTHITTASTFRASLFPRRYSAVLCREVIEHVHDWRGLLGELYAVTLPKGLVQIQTPRPWTDPHPIPYQRAHTQLHAPAMLRSWLERIGFEIVDMWLWQMGQAWLCRRL